MWRALETELRQLLNGHEEGNLGYKPRRNLRATAPVLDPTRPVVGMLTGMLEALTAGIERYIHLPQGAYKASQEQLR